MPVYEYRCGQCGKEYEHLHLSKGESAAPCPSCGSAGERMLSAPSAHSVFGAREAHGGTCCGSATPCDSPKGCCGQGRA
jgi:putative FmdB family regulatory protein